MTEENKKSASETPNMKDAAEMLWVCLANVSGGNWDEQSDEWQEAAVRWRDYYFAAVKDKRPICPDCNEVMAKFNKELEDGSGWIVGWLCKCNYKSQPFHYDENDYKGDAK